MPFWFRTFVSLWARYVLPLLLKIALHFCGPWNFITVHLLNTSQVRKSFVITDVAAILLVFIPLCCDRSVAAYSKWVLKRVQSSASYFKFQHLLFYLRSSSSCWHLLSRLLVPCVFPLIVLSLTCFRNCSYVSFKKTCYLVLEVYLNCQGDERTSERQVSQASGR